MNVLLVTILSLPYFCEWQEFGELVIMVQAMVKDFSTFSLLLEVFMCGFGLALLGLEGEHSAKAFAEIVAATVLAGELSITAALVSKDFTSAHQRLARDRARPGG